MSAEQLIMCCGRLLTQTAHTFNRMQLCLIESDKFISHLAIHIMATEQQRQSIPGLHASLRRMSPHLCFQARMSDESRLAPHLRL